MGIMYQIKVLYQLHVAKLLRLYQTPYISMLELCARHVPCHHQCTSDVAL